MAAAEKRWSYDAGEPWAKKKHGWKYPYAGVQPERYGAKLMRVARCPSGLTRVDAENLLKEHGLPWWDEDDHAAEVPPDRLYGVYEGVPYETRTNANGAFHAFPILPERWVKLPTRLRQALADRAVEQGRDVTKWLEEAAE